MNKADVFVWYTTDPSSGYGHTGLLYKYENSRPWVYEETTAGNRVARLYYDSDGSRFLYNNNYIAREYLNITNDMHTYLPYIRTTNGISVWIRITSLGSSGNGSVTFFNSSGSSLGTQSFSFNSGGTAVISANSTVNNAVASAQVTTNVPVAVTVENNAIPSGFETDAYAGMTNGSDKIYLPLVMRNWGAVAKYTDFNIMNVGASSVTVNLNYYANSGTAPGQTSYTIAPQGFVNIDTRTQSGWSGSAYGSAVISSAAGNATGQILVTARQRRDSDNSSVLFNGINSEDSRVAARAPLIMNANNGWNSGLQVQNSGGRSTTVTVNYYWNDGSWVKSSTAT